MCVCMCFRRGSNRHNALHTSKGTKTSTRVSQALVCVTARHLSGHKTVARMLEKSALRRLSRLSKQDRQAKLMTKVHSTPEAVPTQSFATQAPKEARPLPQKKRAVATALKTAKVAKNKKKQELVLRAIATSKNRTEKRK